jgi:diguanylate cyclase (GGDEF)-like protein/PAS domain S-box-containing protein
VNHRPATVLVVDHSPERLAAWATRLQAEFAVVPAASAEQALQTLENQPPDLVLVDGRSAQAEAAAVCARIKLHARARHTPLVLLAEPGGAADAEQGLLELGVDELITDSPDRPGVLARLRRLVALARAESRLEVAAGVLDTLLEGVLVTDGEDRIVDANRAFCSLTGYSRDELLGKTPAVLRSGRHDEAFFRSLWDSLAVSGRWSGEIWNRMKNGEVHPQQVSIVRTGENGSVPGHYLAVFNDLRMFANHTRQLERLAYYDALTDLPNRSLLEDRIHQAIAHTLRYGGLLGVGFLDVDGFRGVKERFGAEAGDRVLLEVSKRLTELLRAGDTVARVGGDEFVFLLIGLENPTECETITGRIIKLIAEPIEVPGGVAEISGSVGLTFAPTDCINPQALVSHAEEAMRLVKSAGKNGFRVYQPEGEAAGDDAVR